MEFYIDGCHLCQAAAPVIYDMETEFTNKIVLMRLDYNQYYQNSEVVTDLNITNIPAVLVIESKNSEGKYNISGRFEGSIPKEALQTCLEKAINSQ
jgi:ferredoxin